MFAGLVPPSSRDVKRLPLLHQPVAVHLLWPADTKHVHQLVAVALGLQTEAATRQRDPTVLGTNWGVERTQEHPELRGALQVHHGMERLQVETERRNTTVEREHYSTFRT